MAKRWLRVMVERSLTAELFLCVDDADCPVNPCPVVGRIAAQTGTENRVVSLTPELLQRVGIAAQAGGAAALLDWGEDGPADALVAEEVGREGVPKGEWVYDATN